MKKTTVIIAGIGGVGGYFGGLLARHYTDNDQVEINFLARGQHLKAIQSEGLKVIEPGREWTAKPKLATDNPTEIGRADLIIIATKSYDLESVIRQLKPCITKNTVLLPLLNGVDSKDRIKAIYPENLVLDGCVYIVSRLKKTGVIENSGNIQQLHFGQDQAPNDELLMIEKLLKAAGIDAKLSERSTAVIWEKFIFLSPIATATSFYDQCIGELISDPEKLNTIVSLIEEVKQLAQAKQVLLSDAITEKTIQTLKSLPFETTSSMHSDFKNKKSVTELQSLTEYVVEEGRKYGLEMPVYHQLCVALNKKSQENALL